MLKSLKSKSQSIGFEEQIKHPAKSKKSIEEARQLLAKKKAFTYMILDSEVPRLFYLCFYNYLMEFRIHRIKLIKDVVTGEAVWGNGSEITFQSLEKLIPFSMEVLSGVETPLNVE